METLCSEPQRFGRSLETERHRKRRAGGGGVSGLFWGWAWTEFEKGILIESVGHR